MDEGKTIETGFSMRGKKDKSSGNASSEFFLPYADEASRTFSEFSKDNPQRADVLSDVLREFFQEEIQNMQVYTTRDGNASLPYTSINVTEFAIRMYERYGGVPKAHQKVSSEPVKKKTIVFLTSFLAPKSGHPFVFAELAMQQAVRALAPTIQAIQEGRPPKDVRVVTLGSPTNNRWGSISDKYADSMQNDAYTTLGQTYAELLESTGMLFVHTGHDAVVLHGTSMGGSLAAKTAEKLIADGIATQLQNERTQRDLPFLQVRMDSPAGVRREGYTWPRWKKLQVPLGFAGEVIKIAATDRDTIKTALGEDKFLEGLQKETEKRGIPTMHDEQQEKRKKNAVNNLIRQLKSGVSLNPNLKVNLVTGLSDLLTRSRWDRQAERKKNSSEQIGKKGPLGRDIVPSESPQRRELAIKSGHLIPFFKRKSGNEMRVWARSIDKLIEVKNISSSSRLPRTKS